jgi:hypothetical protein
MQSRATVSRPEKSPTLRIESRMRFWSTRKISDWIVDHSDRSGHMTTMDQARTHERSEFRSPTLDPLRGSTRPRQLLVLNCHLMGACIELIV